MRSISAIAAAAALAVCPSAQGGTVSAEVVETSREPPRMVLSYFADAGEPNQVQVAYDGEGEVVVRDTGAAVEPGPGCTALSPNEARCDIAVPLFGEIHLDDLEDTFDGAVDATWNVSGADGDDVLAIMAGAGRLSGGNGTDRVMGGEGADSLDGGGGPDDYLGGGGGNDRLSDGDVSGGFADSDTLDGGPGLDTASYSERALPVLADLLRPQDSGERGESDRLIDIQRLDGGFGHDRLEGDDGRNILVGGNAGDDYLDGRGGDDVVRGWDGDDELFGFGGNDDLDGGVGDDRLDGGDGEDRLWGGIGHDVNRAGPGDDLIDASEPEFWDRPLEGANAPSERVRCGAGRDLVIRTELADVVGAACERVQPPMDGFVDLWGKMPPRPVRLNKRRGSAVFRVACPQRADQPRERRNNRCRGRLYIEAAGSYPLCCGSRDRARYAASRFDIDPGDSAQVRVTLRGRAGNVLRRGRSPRVQVRLHRSLPRGADGPRDGGWMTPLRR